MGKPRLLADVATQTDGQFVVVWTSYYSDGTDNNRSIQAQLFDANGNPRDSQVQVNTYTTGSQRSPSVDADSNGNFVVVWQSNGSRGSDTGSYSVQGQRFAADGTPLGAEFQVNSYTTSYQRGQEAAFNADGDFIIVWHSNGSSGTDTDSLSVQAQRYAADGTPLGTEFQVNTYSTGRQRSPSVATNGEGDFVVVWQSADSYGGYSDGRIRGQRYDADGSPVGGEFQVNSNTTNPSYDPEVAMSPAGGFVVTWTNYYGSAGSDTYTSVQARHFTADALPTSQDFQVNTYTTGGQYYSAVAMDDSGQFLVVWESGGSFGSDTDQSSIQGQRFENYIFSDDFESGDTSAWSGTVP